MLELCDSIVKDIARDMDFKDVSINEFSKNFTGDNFFGRFGYIKLNGVKDGYKKVIDLFYKSCPENKIMRKYMDLHNYYCVETYCYTHILPVLDGLQDAHGFSRFERFLFPKFFKSNLNEGNEVIILEDLSSKGYKICDRRIPLDFEHVEVIIKNLARLHATSFVLMKTNNELFYTLASKIGNDYNYGKRFIEVQKASIRIVSRLIKNAQSKSIIEKKVLNDLDIKYKRYFNAKEVHPYSVICHGDPWINNILFKYENGKVLEAVFVDWQLCRLASPVTDIAYIICLSTDQQFRDQHLTEIFNTYYTTLQETITKMGQDINDCYPRDIFDRHIKEFYQFGLLIAMLALHSFLAEPGGEKSLEDIFVDFETGNYDINLNEATLKRVNDLVNDFISRDLI